MVSRHTDRGPGLTTGKKRSVRRPGSAKAVKVALLLGQDGYAHDARTSTAPGAAGFSVIYPQVRVAGELMRLPAPVAAVSNEVAAVALVISALALGAQSSAPG